MTVKTKGNKGAMNMLEAASFSAKEASIASMLETKGIELYKSRQLANKSKKNAEIKRDEVLCLLEQSKIKVYNGSRINIAIESRTKRAVSVQKLFASLGRSKNGKEIMKQLIVSEAISINIDKLETLCELKQLEVKKGWIIDGQKYDKILVSLSEPE